MTIHLISFASILHKQVSLRSSHEAILSEIEKYYTVKFVDYQDMDKLSSDDFKIIFIATGGVERLVIQHFENLPALPFASRRHAKLSCCRIRNLHMVARTWNEK